MTNSKKSLSTNLLVGESPQEFASTNGCQPGEDILEPAYTQILPISVAKKRDLISLVESGATPPEYQHNYRSLPSCSNVRDALAEPDAEEMMEDGTKAKTV